MTTPLLKIQNLSKHFPVREGLLLRAKQFNQAVNNIDLAIQAGETWKRDVRMWNGWFS